MVLSKWHCLACLWMPFEFLLVAAVSAVFNAPVAGAIVWHWVQIKWLREALALFAFAAAWSLQAIVLGTVVDFLAYKVFWFVPLFNEIERPHYTFGQRVGYHCSFLVRVVVVFAPFEALFENNVTMYGCHPSTVASWSDWRPFALDPPWGSAKAFMRFYVVTAIGVQSSLVLCDVLYWSGHMLQHKSKVFYDWSKHDYHHKFRFPLSACGPWLSAMDLAISHCTTFALPAQITLGLMTYCFGVFDHLPGPAVEQQVCFYRSLFFAYIHYLNHHDHCGKQMPLWSGAPLCPPLGFLLRLDECIPNHESHHNFHSCGYGLLSVADRLFGTNGYPASHPKFLATAGRMGKVAAVKLAALRESKSQKVM